jgi:CheY-like chemotaxis protein
MKILWVDDDIGRDKDWQDLFKVRLLMDRAAARRTFEKHDAVRRRIIEARLAKAGLELEFATDGDEAFKRYCDHGPYDLVITDYVHPGLDGFKLAKAIRRKNPNQVVAMVTVGMPDSAANSLHRLNIPVLGKTPEMVSRLVESVTKPRLRILMVAGDPAVKPLATAHTSFEVELETNGDKALNRYRKRGPYDLVLTGHHHPGPDGCDLAKAICRRNPSQRITMITEESVSVSRTLQRNLRGVAVLKLKSVIKAMEKRGESEIALFAKRAAKRDERTKQRMIAHARSMNPITTAFGELHEGGAQALLELVEAASKINAKSA